MNDILKIRLTNQKNTVTTFVLEPWGDFWLMAAGSTYEIHFEINGNTPADFPEIVMSNDAITVYSGVGSHVLVFENGREINSSSFDEAPLQKAA
jgi:hypothetical protein